MHLETKKALVKECNTARIYQLNTLSTNGIIEESKYRKKCGVGAIKRSEYLLKNKIYNLNEEDERDSYTGLRRVYKDKDKCLITTEYSTCISTHVKEQNKSKLNLNLKNLETQKAIKPASHSLMAQPSLMTDPSRISPNRTPVKFTNIRNDLNLISPLKRSPSSFCKVLKYSTDSSKNVKKYESIEHLFIDDDNFENDLNTKLLGIDSLEYEEPLTGNLFQDFSRKISFEDLSREEKLDTEVVYNKTPLKRGMDWYSFCFADHQKVTES